MGITLAGGFIAGSVMFHTIGGGLTPLAPMLVHFTITTIGTMFWLAIIMGGWPILPKLKNPVLAGLALLVAGYVISFALFQIFYNYQFLIGTPVYTESLDPHGLFNGWDATVFYVAFITMMFVILHLDLWPLTKFPKLMKQPVLGAVFTALTLGLSVLVFYLVVSVFEMNVVAFMAIALIPFVFGSIIVLNMLQDSLFSGFAQPVKGFLKAGLALAIGLVLANIFLALSPLVTRALSAGPPTFEREVWLASALLSVTFPFLMILADFFQFGGLVQDDEASSPDEVTATNSQ